MEDETIIPTEKENITIETKQGDRISVISNTETLEIVWKYTIDILERLNKLNNGKKNPDYTK